MDWPFITLCYGKVYIRVFFSHFSANIGKFIFRNLEFKEKILEFREKCLSLDEKFGILLQNS